MYSAHTHARALTRLLARSPRINGTVILWLLFSSCDISFRLSSVSSSSTKQMLICSACRSFQYKQLTRFKINPSVLLFVDCAPYMHCVCATSFTLYAILHFMDCYYIVRSDKKQSTKSTVSMVRRCKSSQWCVCVCAPFLSNATLLLMKIFVEKNKN